MSDNSEMASNYRSAVLSDPPLMPPVTGVIPNTSNPIPALRTPHAGNVRALPPPLPQMPIQPAAYGGSVGAFDNYSGYTGYGGGGFGGSSFGGYGGFGGGFGNYGAYSGYGGYNSYGGGLYNRFGGGTGGMNPLDPEARFIQLAEASSRPAFQSIESLVSAIGNIASMLDSTFFALTSSFRAILGVAANFGRLRGVFAQFWQTFAIFRGITWIYRKLLYWLRLSNLDPSSADFKKAFAEALNETAGQTGAPKLPRKGQSPWPVLAFLSFIFTAPYLIMKLLGTVMNTAQEEARDPAKWVQPIQTVALYDFQARNPTELSLCAGQRLFIAPREIQNTTGLLNTGWGLATIDGRISGIVPISYVKNPQQLRQEREKLRTEELASQTIPPAPVESAAFQNNQIMQPELLAPNVTFAAPQTCVPDFTIAPQPLSPSSIEAIAKGAGMEA